jgi:hypothetical protein
MVTRFFLSSTRCFDLAFVFRFCLCYVPIALVLILIISGGDD